jgi:GT2 family glycosyltransferase
MLDISIIAVNFNGAKFLNQCLDSVLNTSSKYSYEIIVIDNNSLDNSAQILLEYKNKIKLILNQENTGFSFANNQGIKIAKGKYIFLLNNDTILKPNSLDNLIDYYEKHKNTGAIGPKLLNKDGSIQYYGSILNQWQYKTKVAKKMNFISGAAFLTTKTIMKKIDGLDENFFFYNEDVDLCKKILKLGLPIIYLPQSEIIHLGGASTQTRKAPSIIEGYRGGLYLVSKHYHPLIYFLYRALLLIDIVPKTIYYFVASFINKEKISIAKAYAKIFAINLTNDIYLDRVKKK